MKIFREPGKLQKWCRARKSAGKKIALVPTMGYLHEGHLSLIAEARRRKADEIVVSVFVNPTPSNMYLDRHSTYVVEEDLSKGLCGARRPGHFRGVCTVVAKLFNLAHPDFAVFGQKDYQQAQVVKRMVRDLNFDLDIVVAPIVREPSGLARSSRNTYLSASEREAALVLSRSLAALKAAASASPRPAKSALAKVAAAIGKAGLKVDYVECVDAETLENAKRVASGTCVLVAAYDGKTRLIDNVLI